MTITAYSGPVVGFGSVTGGSTNGITGTNQENNPQRAPSLFDLADGLADPRAFYQYTPGEGITTNVWGWINNQAVVDFAPSSASSNAFAISSNTAPAAGAAVTLVPSSAKGTYTTTIVAPETGANVSVIAIDSTAAVLTFGSAGINGGINIWNPAAGTGRCISITTSSSGDVGSWTIAGRDMYGYKMTETIATSSVTFTTQKAFKYLAATGAITASSVVTSTGVSIGLSDTYGMPFKVSYAGGANLTLGMSSGAASGAIVTAVAASSANFVFGSTAVTATTSTADPRGTWASSLASNGTARMQIVVVPTPQAYATVTSTDMSGLFGHIQYSSV